MKVVHGDCLAVMPTLDAESVDAIVCDPPYGLAFMGKAWDHGVPGPEFWAEALRVAKPGAWMVAAGGTRTFHRLACAIEDAGWEMRDCLMFLHGQGFPKSHNLPGGLGTALKPAFEPIILARKPLIGTVAANVTAHGTGALNIDGCRVGTGEDRSNGGPRPDRAGDPDWRMSGNGERPSGGRWPANVVLGCNCKQRTPSRGDGVLGNMDCPVSGSGAKDDQSGSPGRRSPIAASRRQYEGSTPASQDHDSDCPVALLDAQSGGRRSSCHVNPSDADPDSSAVYRKGFAGHAKPGVNTYSDTGGASRFFYTAKASRSEREAGLEGMPQRQVTEADKWATNDRRSGTDRQPTEWKQAPVSNTHPTVKPLALMRWLCRLVTPPGGLILDPFAGSGSTGCAAVLEGFRFLGIEREAEYCEIARRRIAHHAGTMEPTLEFTA